MRDIVINQWENGIDKLNYNLLIDGEDTAVIPEAMSGIIDTTIVTLINGDGSYESPLEMKINDVEINKIKSFLNNLKQLGNIEIETEENGEYTVFKIKISLADKSLENLYITFNVDNTLVEIIEAVNELKENNSVDPNPEETPEIKPEVVPGGSGNENNAGSNNTEGVDKLPQTGAPISSAQVVFIALVITTIGFVVLKKKENVA